MEKKAIFAPIMVRGLVDRTRDRINEVQKSVIYRAEEKLKEEARRKDQKDVRFKFRTHDHLDHLREGDEWEKIKIQFEKECDELLELATDSLIEATKRRNEAKEALDYWRSEKALKPGSPFKDYRDIDRTMVLSTGDVRDLQKKIDELDKEKKKILNDLKKRHMKHLRLASSDRTAMIRLASSLPVGDESRRTILANLNSSENRATIHTATPSTVSYIEVDFADKAAALSAKRKAAAALRKAGIEEPQAMRGGIGNIAYSSTRGAKLSLDGMKDTKVRIEYSVGYMITDWSPKGRVNTQKKHDAMLLDIERALSTVGLKLVRVNTSGAGDAHFLFIMPEERLNTLSEKV